MLHLDFQTINAFITFCYFLMQFRIAVLQLFQFSTSEKRTDSACYGGGRIQVATLLSLFVRISDFTCLSSCSARSYLLLPVPLGFLYTLQFGFPVSFMMKSLRSRCFLPVSALDCPRSIKRMSEAKLCISVISSSFSLQLFPVSWFIQSKTI